MVSESQALLIDKIIRGVAYFINHIFGKWILSKVRKDIDLPTSWQSNLAITFTTVLSSSTCSFIHDNFQASLSSWLTLYLTIHFASRYNENSLFCGRSFYFHACKQYEYVMSGAFITANWTEWLIVCPPQHYITDSKSLKQKIDVVTTLSLANTWD